MLPIIANIVTALVANNLPKVAQAVVDKGLDYVEEKTGIKLEVDAEGNIPPEKVAELKIAAMKHEEFKMEQETKRTAMEYANVENARELQKAALAQEDKFAKRFVYFFASFWSLVGAVYIFAITFGNIPEANVRIADTTSGFMLGTVLGGMFTYFLGSSLGSFRKDERNAIK